jgi:hypothetical protein
MACTALLILFCQQPPAERRSYAQARLRNRQGAASASTMHIGAPCSLLCRAQYPALENAGSETPRQVDTAKASGAGEGRKGAGVERGCRAAAGVDPAEGRTRAGVERAAGRLQRRTISYNAHPRTCTRCKMPLLLVQRHLTGRIDGDIPSI